MKLPAYRFSLKTLLITFFFIAYILAAYVRGKHLFGNADGVLYAFVAALMTFLFYRALSRSPISKWYVWILILFAVPVSFVFTFPQYFNSDLNYFISYESDARNARAQLNQLFDSDPAFKNLNITTYKMRGGVSTSIDGTLGTKADLERFRSRLLDECTCIDDCSVFWQIEVLENTRTYKGMLQKNGRTLRVDAIYQSYSDFGYTERDK